MRRILIIDDEAVNRTLLVRLLDSLPGGGPYQALQAADGETGLALAVDEHPDLILLDVMMPGLNGIEVCRKLKAETATRDIPVLILTGAYSEEPRNEGLAAGANDFLPKPFNREELELRIRNLLTIKEYSDYLKESACRLEQQVQEKTAQIRAAFARLEAANRQIRQAYLDTVLHLTMAAEYKDDTTATHIRRVGRYALALAAELGLDREQQDRLLYATPMHDIGKLGIPDRILSKPGPLTAEEFEMMKEHTTIGAKILTGSESDILRLATAIAGTHHERWDGTGYPRGLRERQIPQAGRIMMLVDVYDALRSPRPYKPEFSHARTVEIIARGDGRTMPEHFDPDLLALFIRREAEFERIYREFS